MQKKGTIVYKLQLAKIQEMKKQWKLIFKSYMLKKNFGKLITKILHVGFFILYMIMKMWMFLMHELCITYFILTICH